MPASLVPPMQRMCWCFLEGRPEEQLVALTFCKSKWSCWPSHRQVQAVVVLMDWLPDEGFVGADQLQCLNKSATLP
jgi:hypothetical protein